jgi:HD-like signal output (HDOD) protein
MDAKEIAQSVAHIYSLPETYYRINALLGEPNTTNEQLGQVIEFDVGLSARLLKLVNSAYYGRPARVDRIDVAVSLLGRTVLRDLVLATSAVDTFKNVSSKLVDMSTFWYHSVYTGLAARALAERADVLHVDRLFVAGMLHDVGQLAMYEACPEEAEMVLKRAPATDDGVYRTEREVLGFTHADVGRELLTEWNLPMSLRHVAGFHHEPHKSEGHILDVSLVHIGNSIANSVESSRYIESCEPTVESEAWRVTGFDADIVQTILPECEVRVSEVVKIIAPGAVIV